MLRGGEPICDITEANNSKRIKRVDSLVILIFVISAAILSEAFVITHANHKHDNKGEGGGCAICIHIQNAENLLNQLGSALGGTSFAFTGLFAFSVVLFFALRLISSYTLIHLKMRMNN